MKKASMIFAFALFLCPASHAAEFHGYACTQDCSGHKAGYEWAKEKNIVDPANCKGRSKSFVEGCRAFTQNFEETPYQTPGDKTPDDQKPKD